MDMIIIIKWLTNYEATTGTHSAPSIITTMITMCLNFGVQPPESTDAPLIANQTWIMQTLLVLVLVCVPTMLFVKPVYENNKHKKEDHKTSPIIKREPEVDRQYVAINEGTHVGSQIQPQSALENYL